MEKKLFKYGGKDFSEVEQHQIIQDYISSGWTKRKIWYKYTGLKKEKGEMLRWMRNLGYKNGNVVRRAILVSKYSDMPKKQKDEGLEAKEFEILQLKNRNLELEKKIQEAELKAIAFSTMIEIAEKEFNVPIRKKFNTKL